MNILIIGLGSIGKKHLTAIKALGISANVYALRSNNDAEQYEDVTNLFSLDDLSVRFNFAIIANPTYLHTQYIEVLSAINVPLFIEKPVSNSLYHLDTLVNKVDSEGLLTYVGCNLRFHPCIQFLKKELANISSESINEVNVYSGSYLPNWRPDVNFREVYSSNSDMGGGVHLDLFHEMDYVVWLLGFPEKSSSVLKSNSSLKIDAVDYANYVLEYSNFTASIILNYYRRQNKRTIEIILNDFTWIIDLVKAEITDEEGGLIFRANDFNMKDTYKLQMAYFIGLLKTNKKSFNTIQQSVEILKMVLN